MQAQNYKFEPMYGHMGSLIYEAMTTGDHSEVRALLSILPRGEVLELACGDGRLTLPLLARGNRVYAVDNSPQMLHLLSKKAARRSSLADRLTVSCQDISSRDSTYPGMYDATFIGASSITLFEQPERVFVLHSMSSVTKPQGLVAVTQFTPRASAHKEMHFELESIGASITLVEEEVQSGDARDIYIMPHELDGRAVSKMVMHHRVKILSEADLFTDFKIAGVKVEDVSEIADGSVFGTTRILVGRPE
ncbi:class I SAM-dependent methyltransferase [Micrococcus sp. ACRRV]|uniref:class I SAM-dependent methyltransferase n=1 Tax=Micrococcus sp. ACRRV TaxID=2918203 RepID=UPI001EF2ECEE|nr:class I SAM-dependent methyltransferase [Micrococcus sp. ACRRV]MCG7421924.1 class I SAM-dependent methyltransferase [Micrococcus sp. ACRRV]